MKRKAFDGREVVFVTEDTQTDWAWQDDAEKMSKLKQLAPRDSKLCECSGLALLTLNIYSLSW